ncbi:MAG: hypothetical protein KDK91_05360 [Gammaproteobacteria bacterium]|nr:hypothetical protein [Gammaproteobacteria bacterium]
MNRSPSTVHRPRVALLGMLLVVLLLFASSRAPAQDLQQQNARLFQVLKEVHGLSDTQLTTIRRIFERSGVAGQGNPAITRHPMSEATCRQRRDAAGRTLLDSRFEQICGAPFMAPLYDPARESAEQARACIDQFEFPDVPCEYPVVWVRAREAALVCEAMGKRLCDAHEWEGACAGALRAPDYRFDLARGVSPGVAIKRMRDAHNREHEPQARWSYGPAYRKGVCAAASSKSPGCQGGGWSQCGSNTFPAGGFPDCRSGLDVYDLNGNAAEHMNLPLKPDEMASRGSDTLGYTEMKGSWFIFDSYRAHPDWCRWRAPYWHGSRVMDEHSHHNYHLGFRCCKSIQSR